MPRHRDGVKDDRYRITHHVKKQHVVWFCDNYIGQAPTRDAAKAIAQYHADTGGGGDRPPLIPEDYPVRPLPPEQVAEPLGKDVVTCGDCHRSWDDAVVTSMTPAPSARCPFEPFHY